MPRCSGWSSITPSSHCAANLQALGFQLAHADEPRWRELATLRAWIGLVADGHMRHAEQAALQALGRAADPLATFRLAWSWWLEGATHFLLSHQADRLTRAWCAAHVAGSPRVPQGGAVFISLHHFNQRIAWVCLSNAVERLGMISWFHYSTHGAQPPSPHRSAGVDQVTAARQLTVLYRRTFGDRIFTPPRAALPALRLVESGGSIIISPDGYVGPERGTLLGRSVGIGPGALWLARGSGKPIVPFSIVPEGTSWRLWCGDAIPPDQRGLERALEECIRQSLASWMLMPEWFDAPRAYAS